MFYTLSKFHRIDEQKHGQNNRDFPSDCSKSIKNSMFSSNQKEKLCILCIIYSVLRVGYCAMGENGDKLNRLMPFFMAAFSRLAKINREFTFDR